jgi:hypothetical protein
LLTINEEFRLQKKVRELSDITRDSDYIIKGRLEEKDKQIQQLTERELFNSDAIAGLSDQIQQLSLSASFSCEECGNTFATRRE